jgi:hypothetical protein
MRDDGRIRLKAQVAARDAAADVHEIADVIASLVVSDAG